MAATTGEHTSVGESPWLLQSNASAPSWMRKQAIVAVVRGAESSEMPKLSCTCIAVNLMVSPFTTCMHLMYSGTPLMWTPLAWVQLQVS